MDVRRHHRFEALCGRQGLVSIRGRGTYRINSAGLRDREHPKAKPPNTVRVAVLGDSMTEALQVPVERAYWSVFSRELSG